jgi:hypothetical protein
MRQFQHFDLSRLEVDREEREVPNATTRRDHFDRDGMAFRFTLTLSRFHSNDR